MNYSGVICEKGWQEEVDKLMNEAHMSNESARLELLNYYTEIVPCDEACGHLEKDTTMTAEEKQTEFQFGDVVRDKGTRLEGDIINVRTVHLYTVQMKQYGHWFEITREGDQIEKVTELPLRIGDQVETPNDGEIGTIVGLTDTEALVEYDNEGYDYFPLSKLKSLD